MHDSAEETISLPESVCLAGARVGQGGCVYPFNSCFEAA